MRFFLVGVLLLSIGCGEGTVSPDHDGHTGGISYIDEPILLQEPEYVFPSMNERGEAIFDLRGTSIGKSAGFVDIGLGYMDGGCGSNVWVYNPKRHFWQQIAFPIISGFVCPDWFFPCFVLFSARGLDYSGFVDRSNFNAEITVKGVDMHKRPGWNPYVAVYRFNPNYYSIPLPIIAAGSENFYSGLTYVGDALLASTYQLNKIYRHELDGRISEEIDTEIKFCRALAFDGEYIWTIMRKADGMYVSKANPAGEILDQFIYPFSHPFGIAWGDNSIWATGDFNWDEITLYRIDPVASCSSGNTVVLDSFRVPIDFPLEAGRGSAIGWDGDFLLVVTDSLYRYTPSGVKVKSYALAVEGIADIAWDGETVWMLNTGPSGVESCQVISRFRLH